jgi:hypothetical protein
MSESEEDRRVEHQLQVLDVNVADGLSYLEALLGQCHSIQRELLQLRTETLPLSPPTSTQVIGAVTGHVEEMRREWGMLGEIIDDLKAGLGRVSREQYSERRSGRDRRRVRNEVLS